MRKEIEENEEEDSNFDHSMLIKGEEEIKIVATMMKWRGRQLLCW